MRRSTQLSLIFTAVGGIAILLILLGPASLRWLAFVVVAIGLGVNALLLRRGIRADRAAVERIVASHPGSVVRPTGLSGQPGMSRAQRSRVVALIADRSGLSFRDAADAEVLKVPADGILSLELGPMNGRIRPAQVTRLDGPTVEFFVGASEDRQLDTIVAVRKALGRPTG
ncbi:MAG: hypothetical protein ABI632_11010 [Pseudolysinimonas sp.]